MSTGDYIEFTIFFGFLILWIIIHSIGTFRTDRILKTQWGRSVWRNSSVRKVRLISGIFFIGRSIVSWLCTQRSRSWRFQVERKT
jgi:hypothetical protein